MAKHKEDSINRLLRAVHGVKPDEEAGPVVHNGLWLFQNGQIVGEVPREAVQGMDQGQVDRMIFEGKEVRSLVFYDGRRQVRPVFPVAFQGL